MLALMVFLFGKSSPEKEFSERAYLFANVVLDSLCAASWMMVNIEKATSWPLALVTAVTTFGASFVWWKLLTWNRTRWLSSAKVLQILAFAGAWTITAIVILQFREQIGTVWLRVLAGVAIVALTCFGYFVVKGSVEK
jgi:hypothetical protein